MAGSYGLADKVNGKRLRGDPADAFYSSSENRKRKEHMKKQFETEAEQFLMQVLSIPSVNGTSGEADMANFLVTYLKSCGINAVIQNIDEIHANVIAVLEGETKEKVIWNGHLDTVPYGKLSEWTTDPKKPVKKNGCLFARGASDMKSGLAGMVYALGYMKRQGYQPKQTIYFFGTCDEERDGTGAKAILKEGRMEEASLLLIGEPTGCTTGIAQKGCLWLNVKLSGKTSHGAYPERGVNAVHSGFLVYECLKQRLEQFCHPILGRPTIQITMVSGGIVPNMVPDEAEFVMDIRITPEITAEQVKQWCSQIAQELQEKEKRLQIEFTVLNNRTAIETDGNQRWVKKIDWETRCENMETKHTGIHYFTDASVLAQDIPELPVVLFGPGEASMAHQPDEYVEIEKYIKYIKILSRLF